MNCKNCNNYMVKIGRCKFCSHDPKLSWWVEPVPDDDLLDAIRDSVHNALDVPKREYSVELRINVEAVSIRDAFSRIGLKMNTDNYEVLKVEKKSSP